MCGRFETNISTIELANEIISENPSFSFDEDLLYTSHNIAPTQNILTLVSPENSDSIKFRIMHWGIKFRQDSPLIFNSRIETIKEKTFWLNLFDKNRCLIPMTGFYEWKTEGKSKTPYRVSLEQSNYFYVPGLFLIKENEYYTSLITTVPNKFIKQIHHRMPVILTKDLGLKYLRNSVEENFRLSVPFPNTEKMQMQRASL